MGGSNHYVPMYSITKKGPALNHRTFAFQKRKENGHPNPPSSVIFISIFITFIITSVSQPSTPDCILDFKTSTFGSNLGCGGGNWGQFLSNNCCGIALDEYLYVLGQRANKTGKIYLNPSEQRTCLDSMKNFNGNILYCGVRSLASGGGGCSDFTVDDVSSKLRSDLRSLRDDCNFSNEEGGPDPVCSTCLRRWNETARSLNGSNATAVRENYTCRFAVLVSLISSRIDNEKWVRAIYKCLGENDQNQGLWIVVGGIIGIAVLAAIMSWHFMRKQSNKLDVQQRRDGSEELVLDITGCQKIPIKEIYAATNNLNVRNFIGQGIAGKVYKGMLSNGRRVAIKHIIKDEYGETFVREVTSLSHVKHQNLVQLLGHCEEGKECFLVYELCTNGTLSKWLFGKDKVLSWTQRLEIAIDSARGLYFLHTYPEGCIVHRDIKPTNVLLGDDFEAKLSDFGLSKVMALGQSYVSSEVRGTFGYVDPEYQRNHHVNPSSDVYSFGIVLLQILSGKRVINLDVTRPKPLDKMAKMLSRAGNISEFVDPKLNGEFSMGAFNLVLKLALSCTSHKQQRPKMEQVVVTLERALDISTSSESYFSTAPSSSQTP